MRYLIGALGALVILFGSSAAASAATASCGRVTTFVAPNSAGALITGDGWLIVAKADGTSEKVIVRSGSLSSFGGIGGYVCVAVDGVYLAGLIAPGGAGYVPEVASLPSTATAPPDATVILGLGGTLLVAGLALLAVGARRDSRG